jgi:DNA-binding PadR family transcriptional regulator
MDPRMHMGGRGRHGPGGRDPGGPPGGGPGGPRGPFGFGGSGGFPFRFPFHHGHRARRGDIRAGILALLAEQPRNGYQIMQELEQRSQGVWRPSPGSVYPALQQIEDEGLISGESTAGGRVFQLTDKGRAYVEGHREQVSAPWAWASNAAGDPARELFGLFRNIAPAIAQITTTGTAAQIVEARKLLIETRRSLYRILAEDVPPDDADDDADDE